MPQLTIAWPPPSIAAINATVPATGASNNIGDRAIRIVEEYFTVTDPGSVFVILTASSSLCRITLTTGVVKEFLVKGTSSPDFSFPQMKIAGQRLYDRLTSTGTFAGQPRLPIYRVRDVNSNSPTIWEVIEGTDFHLNPEPRWTGRA